MGSSERNNLVQLMEELASVLVDGQSETLQKQALEDLVEQNELEGADAAPLWLIAILTSVKDRKLTGHWVDFTRDSGDDTNVFDFIRQLHLVLPITYENNEESWLLTFPKLDLEACISLEGSCYKVSGIGDTWELEDELN